MVHGGGQVPKENWKSCCGKEWRPTAATADGRPPALPSLLDPLPLSLTAWCPTEGATPPRALGSPWPRVGRPPGQLSSGPSLSLPAVQGPGFPGAWHALPLSRPPVLLAHPPKHGKRAGGVPGLRIPRGSWLVPGLGCVSQRLCVVHLHFLLRLWTRRLGPSRHCPAGTEHCSHPLMGGRLPSPGLLGERLMPPVPPSCVLSCSGGEPAKPPA